jgi:hypothetical protein
MHCGKNWGRTVIIHCWALDLKYEGTRITIKFSV